MRAHACPYTCLHLHVYTCLHKLLRTHRLKRAMMRVTALGRGEEAEEEGSLFLPRSLTLRGIEHSCPMPAVKVVPFFSVVWARTSLIDVLWDMRMLSRSPVALVTTTPVGPA